MYVSFESTLERAAAAEPASDISDTSRGDAQRPARDLVERRRTWRPWRLRSAELGRDNRRKDETLAVVSHELRNSLGVIRSAAFILNREISENPTVLNARLLIDRQVGQMTRLIDDLLDVSRIRRGQLRLQCERIDLCTVVARAVQTVELCAKQREHRITTAFPGTALWLHADAIRLEQVFVNLLGNAAKYTDVGGDIRVTVEHEAAEAVVRVRDNGIGIAAEILPHVFELFMQASQQEGAGLGIGLALVRDLVESHGGRVSATSAGLGQGSEFTVTLPMLPG
jgi:signal transduction histidine kinase